MTSKPEDRDMTAKDPFAPFFNFNEGAFAPVARFNQLTAETFEQVARYQYELAGDLLEAGIEQVNLMTRLEKPEELIQAEMDLGQNLGKKLGKRSETFLKIATETQQRYRDLAGKAAAEVKAKAKAA
jgi:hypothetical protein